jgi:hypothetical protein
MPGDVGIDVSSVFRLIVRRFFDEKRDQKQDSPRLFAKTSLGVCAIQSSTLKLVPGASKSPSSKTRRYSFWSAKP